jgi:hypothetical protein
LYGERDEQSISLRESGIFLTVVFIIFASEAWAWGEEGHSIVAEMGFAGLRDT